MFRPVQRRFHRDRSVRLHASGKWICTIGRVWSVKKSKLVDKDWYFGGSEGDAIEKANDGANDEVFTDHRIRKAGQNLIGSEHSTREARGTRRMR